jgi:hypothetical protein
MSTVQFMIMVQCPHDIAAATKTVAKPESPPTNGASPMVQLTKPIGLCSRLRPPFTRVPVMMKTITVAILIDDSQYSVRNRLRSTLLGAMGILTKLSVHPYMNSVCRKQEQQDGHG